jgi:hypothetical protein
VAQRQFTLADGFCRVAKRLRHVLGREVGQLAGDLGNDIPSATIATTVVTGMRRPRMVGMPPITSGSTVIRSNVTG